MIVFQVLSSIVISRYLLKKELASVLILVRKIFSSKLPLKSSLPNTAAVKELRNCCERISNIAVIKYFQNGTFETITITVTVVVLIQFSRTVGSERKTKMKTQIIMAPSYRLKVGSTQNKRVPFFSCLAHRVSPCLGKVKVFTITPT